MKLGFQVLEKTDNQGRVRMAGLHDAKLNTLAYTSGALLEISLRGQNDEVTALRVTKPYVMNIVSLWEGSIVDALFAWNVKAVPEQLWSEPENGWNALLEQRVDPNDRRREAERLARRHPSGILIVVSCSYGGRWAAVGEEVSLYQQTV